ncbi:MAG: zinc-ribbon domain-containing protein [Lachnospiraceae bacterium]|nr:zinc-ribbon domain-containing protein [Lachnospiraceae bacterium]
MISFAEKHPELLKEWDPSNTIRPQMISYGSNKKVLWKGSCGHSWEATIKNRGNNHGCPYCSGNKVLAGFNDLASVHPELVKDWSELNMKSPGEYTKRSIQYAIWKCSKCGHVWRARIADRAEGHGCPVCAGEIIKEGYNDLNTLYPEIAAEWSERNKKKPSQVFPKSREYVWWKCRSCGNEWKAVIDSRVKGIICHFCTRDKNRRIRAEAIKRALALKRNSIGYYAEKSGCCVRYKDDGIIGIPLQIYFPEKRVAVEYSSKNHRRGDGRRIEFAKNWLCINTGIKMIRILDPGEPEFDNCICITKTDDSREVMEAVVYAVFEFIGIDADIDFDRDLNEIMSYEISYEPAAFKPELKNQHGLFPTKKVNNQ